MRGARVAPSAHETADPADAPEPECRTPESRVPRPSALGSVELAPCGAPPLTVCVCVSVRLRVSDVCRRLLVVSTERCEPPAWPPEELSKKATSLHVLSSSITETSRHVLGGDVARSGETRDVPTSRVTTSHDGVMMPRLDRAPTFVLAALGPTCD